MFDMATNDPDRYPTSPCALILNRFYFRLIGVDGFRLHPHQVSPDRYIEHGSSQEVHRGSLFQFWFNNHPTKSKQGDELLSTHRMMHSEGFVIMIFLALLAFTAVQGQQPLPVKVCLHSKFYLLL